MVDQEVRLEEVLARNETGPVIDLSQKRFLTFDCYGTLIDWETGILNALAPVLAHHQVEAHGDDLLVSFARHQSPIESGPYRRYPDVLAATLEGMAAELGFTPHPAELEQFSHSVGDWPAFSDTVAGLQRLADRYGLVILSNIDDDLFEASRPRLGVEFLEVVTAQQVGSYKPNPAHFHTVLERLACQPDAILHVAQSLYHDHGPAQALGWNSVWINRRHDKPGTGATAESDARPDLTFNDLASFAEWATR